ncbi:unnamed protein product [Sphacelaria rigidula]
MKQYQAMVGSLIFLSQCTRFDIAFSVTQVARNMMSKPTTEHIAAVKRIFRYLKGTPDLPIVYRSSRNNLELKGFADSSWKENEINIWDYVFLANGLIHFSSSLQRITASSTTEAELIALARGGKFGTYLFNLLRELGWSLRPPTIFSDSQGALHLSLNANYSKKSKHLALRFYSLKDLINNDQVIVNHVRTSRQLADILTKYCEKAIHRRLLNAVADFGK